MLSPLVPLLCLASLSHAWISSTVKGAGGTKKDGTLLGFNYAPDDEFYTKFTTAKALVGAEDKFLSARLIQMTSNNGEEYTEAINAARSVEGMTLLLGLWASGKNKADKSGKTEFASEKAALKAMLDDWIGKPGHIRKNDVKTLKNTIVGISVGSEDLDRAKQTANGVKGVAYGNTVKQLMAFVEETRALLSTYGLRGTIPVGHSDTSLGWGDSATGGYLAKAIDFIALTELPYMEAAQISTAPTFFDTALQAAMTASTNGGQPPVWVTATGWPVTGPIRNGNNTANSTIIRDNNSNSKGAVPSADYAGEYWQEVGCKSLFGMRNTWWSSLYEPAWDKTPKGKPQYAVAKGDAQPSVQFDLDCSAPSRKMMTRTVRRGPLKRRPRSQPQPV